MYKEVLRFAEATRRRTWRRTKQRVVGARTQGRRAKGRALGLLETFFKARNFVFWNKKPSIHKTIPLIVYVTMIIEGNSFSI